MGFSVKEQLITFVQYVDLESGTPQTDFLSIDELEDPKGPFAEVITNKLLSMLNTCQLTVQRLGSIVSDGASVMLGRHNGAFKYNMISWKDCIPESIKTFKSKETPLHWMLKRLLGLKK